MEEFSWLNPSEKAGETARAEREIKRLKEGLKMRRFYGGAITPTVKKVEESN